MSWYLVDVIPRQSQMSLAARNPLQPVKNMQVSGSDKENQKGGCPKTGHGPKKAKDVGLTNIVKHLVLSIHI
jgi:hypothetical protein